MTSGGLGKVTALPEFNAHQLVRVKAERVTNISSTDYPGHSPNEDHAWSLIQVKRLSNRSIDFDVVGVDASIVNAFRRIMIAEVPTMAIECIYVFNNMCIIQDKVHAHRLGLITLNVDPAPIEPRLSAGDATNRNIIIFKVNIKCARNPDVPKDATEPEDLYIDHGFLFPSAPMNLDIVLAQLRPGQEIKIDLCAVKGVGKDHIWGPHWEMNP
ncbi:DNA-directed RNA polymerase [Armillaria mellea]|nr:DNA-directed RNA polymerase [Armillaria mellea]